LFCQVDKATLIGETINFIKTLEETKAQLEKKKLEQALARQATAEAAAGGGVLFLSAAHRARAGGPVGRLGPRASAAT